MLLKYTKGADDQKVTSSHTNLYNKKKSNGDKYSVHTGPSIKKCDMLLYIYAIEAYY